MFSFAALVLPVLLPVSFAAGVGLQPRGACTDVHLFLARGNGEPYPGRVGAISDTVCSGLPSCDYEDIEFNSNQDYCSQARDGASAGVSQVNAYASRCPNSKLVLAGYSLGAHIVGDALGGGGGNFYNCFESSNAGLSASSGAGSHVAAVLMFGDVRHVANQPYNSGPGSGMNGQYPRQGSQLANLNQFSNVIRSYCLATDPICALGNDGLSHETYMDVYANAAAYWAQGILGFAEPGASTVIAPPTPTPTPSQEEQSSAPATTSPPEASSDFSSGSSSTGSDESSTTSSSSAESSSSTISSSSVSVNPTTFKPFVFASATSTWKSSSLHSSTLSTISRSTTVTPKPVFTTPTVSNAAVQTTSSKAGAFANNAQLTLSFVSLIVIKVLTI